MKSGDITGKPGTTLLVHRSSGPAKRVLLVGLGAQDGVTDRSFLSAVQAVARVFATLGSSDGVLALPLDAVKGRDAHWALRAEVTALRESVFRADGLKSKKDESSSGVRKVTLIVDATDAATKRALTQSIALANGMDLAKTLGNLPPNICTPTYLADTAKKIAREFSLGVEVLDRKQLEALKMGSFLSVTNGSDQPPKFIVLKHMGGKAKEAPVVLVGKGITFDTGGISLKPGSGMD